MVQALLQYNFLQYAFVTGLVIGVIAPLMGVFLVVRRMSMIADALSHITLAGVAAGLLAGETIAVLAGWDPIVFGMLFAVLGALFIENLRKAYKSYQELAIPILLSAGIGLGVVLISLSKGSNMDIFGYLFGNILAVTFADLLRVTIAGAIVLLVVLVLYKELLHLSFDEESARIAGIPYRSINIVFAILIALVISISMQVVGILLVSAMITLPVATSMQWAKSFKQMFVFAIIFGELAVVLGLIAAYYLNIASGGAITLLSVLFLVFSLAVKRLTRPSLRKMVS